ncbi:hypothetical protein CBER1_01164 [Cercospora berteroae]|uniref:DUF7905 domain-containing protein n=1 Tax=Cercospora berteroae TaxID=357750 RepID=A0A2S6CIU7_9PEZI|nr:hypothetical protein CBER1_01164 [Cercospora berteroae]
MDYEAENSRSWQQAVSDDTQKSSHAQSQTDAPKHPPRSGGSVSFDSKAFEKSSNASASSRPRRPATRTALREDRGPTAKEKNFAKLASLTPELRRRHEKRWARAVQSSRFRQPPPIDQPFGSIGTFIWPSNDYKPQDVFGTHCEALDFIRVGCESYVIWVPEKNCFQVMGDNVQNVTDALIRLRSAYFQLTARSMNGVRRYFSHWRSNAVPSHIALEPYKGPLPLNSTSIRDDEKLVHAPRGEGEFGATVNALADSLLSVQSAKMLLANALKKMHYFRGHLTLGIRLGTLLLEQYMPPQAGLDLYELEEYEAMIKQPQFVARVSEELANPVDADVLSAIQAADDLFCPQDAFLDRLEEVLPSYAAIFTFPAEDSDVRLVKSWQRSVHESDLPGTTRMIANPDQFHRSATNLLDVSLTDLHTGTAWQFDLTAELSVVPSKLLEKYSHFAASISLEAPLNKSNEFVVKYNSAGVTMKSLRYEVRYRFNIKGTDYNLDLVRFRDRTFSKGEMIVFEPAWKLNVFRPEWAENLSRNKDLAVGTSANWSHNIDEWFPGDGGEDGVALLVSKLTAIEEVLQAARAGDQENTAA